jgi:gas vesicle protein
VNNTIFLQNCVIKLPALETTFVDIKLITNIMSTGKIIIGVLAGATVGAALGILFAPDKGSVTRKKLRKKSSKYVDKLENEFNEFIDSITREYEALREEALKMDEEIDMEADEAEV